MQRQGQQKGRQEDKEVATPPRKMPPLPRAKDLSGVGGIKPKVDTTKGVSRLTKRPRKRVPRGVRQAEALSRQIGEGLANGDLTLREPAPFEPSSLTDAQIVAGLRLTTADLAALQELTVNPGRNAMSQVAAARVRLEFTMRKVSPDTDNSTTVIIKDFGGPEEVKNGNADGEAETPPTP